MCKKKPFHFRHLIIIYCNYWSNHPISFRVASHFKYLLVDETEACAVEAVGVNGIFMANSWIGLFKHTLLRVGRGEGGGCTDLRMTPRWAGLTDCFTSSALKCVCVCLVIVVVSLLCLKPQWRRPTVQKGENTP